MLRDFVAAVNTGDAKKLETSKSWWEDEAILRHDDLIIVT